MNIFITSGPEVNGQNVQFGEKHILIYMYGAVPVSSIFN